MTTSSMARPRWSSPRRDSRPTWGPRVGKVAEALGLALMPWQQELADLALECDDQGNLKYREVRVTVPRQSGKSTLILAKNIQRMVDAKAFGGRQRLTYTAQDRISAKAKLVDDWMEDLRSAPRFKGRWKPRLVIGEESIRWENGSIWGIQSNKETSGHGGTRDVGDVDEAFAHVDDRVEQALKPAMVTRRNAQLWVVSTAGTERSLYLKGKVDSGRLLAESGVDAGVCYVEYSADPDDDPEDPLTWRRCMPALGLTVSEDTIRSELASMGLAGFSRAYLNLWVPSTFGQQAIPAEEWKACEDPKSQIQGNRVVIAVDVAPDSAWASIAVGGFRSDGVPHVEVIENRAGDDWVVQRLVELRATLGRRPIIIDPVGPVGGLLAEMNRRHLRLVTIRAQEMGQACSGLKSATKAGGWRHLGQDVLADALKGAGTRQLLDGWAWKRTSSSCDISPLVATTLALWGTGTQIKAGGGSSESDLLASVG